MIINDGHDDNPTLEESTPRVSALPTYRGIDWSLCGAVLIKYMWQGSKKMENLCEPYHIFEGALPHIWGSLTTYLRESYHIFEGGVEVFDILRTFCLRCKSIIHIEENHTTGFGHVAERNMFQGYVEMRLSWTEKPCTALFWKFFQNMGMFWKNFQKSVCGDSFPFPSLYWPPLSSASASLWWWRGPTPPKKLVSPSSNDASSVNVHHSGTREIYFTLLCMFKSRKKALLNFFYVWITLGPGVFLACERKL